MFKINQLTKEIILTRGDIATIRVSSKNDDESDYMFQPGDVVRFKVFKKKDCSSIVLQKDVVVEELTETVDFELTKQDTSIESLINKHVSYWYEIELNPETNPQTIVGYELDEEKKPLEKIFTLLPEGSDLI